MWISFICIRISSFCLIQILDSNSSAKIKWLNGVTGSIVAWTMPSKLRPPKNIRTLKVSSKWWKEFSIVSSVVCVHFSNRVCAIEIEFVMQEWFVHHRKVIWYFVSSFQFRVRSALLNVRSKRIKLLSIVVLIILLGSFQSLSEFVSNVYGGNFILLVYKIQLTFAFSN